MKTCPVNDIFKPLFHLPAIFSIKVTYDDYSVFPWVQMSKSTKPFSSLVLKHDKTWMLQISGGDIIFGRTGSRNPFMDGSSTRISIFIVIWNR